MSLLIQMACLPCRSKPASDPTQSTTFIVISAVPVDRDMKLPSERTRIALYKEATETDPIGQEILRNSASVELRATESLVLRASCPWSGSRFAPAAPRRGLAASWLGRTAGSNFSIHLSRGAEHPCLPQGQVFESDRQSEEPSRGHRESVAKRDAVTYIAMQYRD